MRALYLLSTSVVSLLARQTLEQLRRMQTHPRTSILVSSQETRLLTAVWSESAWELSGPLSSLLQVNFPCHTTSFWLSSWECAEWRQQQWVQQQWLQQRLQQQRVQQQRLQQCLWEEEEEAGGRADQVFPSKRWRLHMWQKKETPSSVKDLLWWEQQ